MRKSGEIGENTWFVRVKKYNYSVDLPTFFISFCHCKLNIQWIPKKRSFGKLSIFNKWIKVVVDKPLMNYIERDAKKGTLGFFIPTGWPLWIYNKAKLFSLLVYQVLWERIKRKIFCWWKWWQIKCVWRL